MRFARRRTEASGTPLAPLLDVVLLLLIFFVVTSSFATQTLELELPSAGAASDSNRNALVVAIDASGSIAVDGRKIAVAELAERLAAARDADRPIELRADRKTDHEHVVAVLDRAQSLGVVDLAIAVGAPVPDEAESSAPVGDRSSQR